MSILSYSKAELDGCREQLRGVDDKKLLEVLLSKNNADENAILGELAKDSYVRRFGQRCRDVGHWKKNGNMGRSDTERRASGGSISDGNKFSTSSAPNQHKSLHKINQGGSSSKIPRRQQRFAAAASGGGRHFSSPASIDNEQPAFDEFGMPVFTSAKGRSKGGFCSAQSPPNNRFGYGAGGASVPDNGGQIRYGMPRGSFVTDRHQRSRDTSVTSSNNGVNQWASVSAAMNNAAKHQQLSSSSAFSANSSPSPLNSPAPFFQGGGNQKSGTKHKARKDTPYTKPDAEGGYVKFKRNCAVKKHKLNMAEGGKVFTSTSEENFEDEKVGNGRAVSEDKAIFTEASSSDSESEFIKRPLDHYDAVLLLDSDAHQADVENNDEEFSFDCDGGEKIVMPKAFDAHVAAYLHYFKLINEGLSRLFARL